MSSYVKKISNDIESIDKNIENLQKVTKEWIEAIEERKRQILKSTMNKGKNIQPTAEEIECILQDMDREIQRIQEEHNAALLQMQQTQNTLRARLESLEKLESLVDALTSKICETDDEFRQEMEENLKLREEIIKSSSADKALALAELEKKIADCRNMHESLMASLEGQRREIQQEVSLTASKLENALDSSMRLYNMLQTGLDSQGQLSYLEDHLQVPVCTPMTPETESSFTSETMSESDMSSQDAEYLKLTLGKPLALAIAEITAKQPRDPIHYLGHWLLKYRYNQEVDEHKKREIKILIDEREKLEKQKLHTMLEEEAKNILGKLAIRAEEEAIKRELQRIAEQDDEEFEG